MKEIGGGKKAERETFAGNSFIWLTECTNMNKNKMLLTEERIEVIKSVEKRGNSSSVCPGGAIVLYGSEVLHHCNLARTQDTQM